MAWSSQQVLASQASMIAVSTIAIILRFWSRISTHNGSTLLSRLWWDDWFALADLPFVVASCAMNIYWVSIGLGKHYASLSPANQAAGWKILYAEYFPYDIGISLSKLSVIFFYARVFKINAQFKRFLWLTGGLVVCWVFFSVISAIFQCTPIRKAWLPLEPGHCLNLYSWWLGSAISSLIIDFIILMLPIPLLWKLEIRTSRKIFVSVIFICGYSVIGITIGRLVAVARYGSEIADDLTVTIIPIGLWLSIEGPVALLCVSLPAIYSLIKRGMNQGPSSLFSLKGSVKSRVGMASHEGVSHGNGGFTKLTVGSADYNQDEPYQREPNTEYVALAKKTSNSESQNEHERVGNRALIHVREDISVTSENIGIQHLK